MTEAMIAWFFVGLIAGWKFGRDEGIGIGIEKERRRGK